MSILFYCFRFHFSRRECPGCRKWPTVVNLLRPCRWSYLTLYRQIGLSSRFLKKTSAEKIFFAPVCLDILSGIRNLYCTSLLSKNRLSLLHINCRNLSKRHISEICCNLAFSTYNAFWMPKFCGISSVLVQRKQLWYNANYYIRKYFKSLNKFVIIFNDFLFF